MSHQINTTIGFSRSDRNIKTALKKYFEPGSYDLSYQAILPSPRGLHGEQLMIWRGEHWGSRPFTFDGKIRDNNLKFYTLNGIPLAVYVALAKRLQTSVLVTTASTDDMEWTQIEIHPNGCCRVIYSANETESRGPVPQYIRQFIASHKALCQPESSFALPNGEHECHMKPRVECVGEGVPF